jgi:hypothetical protein
MLLILSQCILNAWTRRAWLLIYNVRDRKQQQTNVHVLEETVKDSLILYTINEIQSNQYIKATHRKLKMCLL